MRVMFDDQIFSHQAHGGISNYFLNLAVRYMNDPNLEVDLSGFPILTKNAHLKEIGLGVSLPVRRLNKRPVLMAANQVISAFRHVRREPHPDVVHHTYYFDRPWRTHPKSRHVITIHDMIPELFPEHFGSGNPHALKGEHILAADAIACVSETTKRDLLSLYPGLDVPIVVTPLGVSDDFNPGPEDQGEHGNYFLFVGARGGYKNFDVLLQAFSLLAGETSADLVVVGGGAFRAAESDQIKRLGLEHRIRHLSPTNRELEKLYRGAICLVFPSKYEGFGLPTLEAMASGCPALLADTPALVEVGGDAGEYFKADDSELLANKMMRVTNDTDYRLLLKARGLNRVSLFSWSATAAKTQRCYQLALSA
ncbi:D-inositol 3-phosphate glycosyltransferase [Arthrobacter sp. Hiyo6]|nr:D-inositol 3-phosphate glycosyltransferase [Arthrobacter sp. Hiyo6]